MKISVQKIVAAGLFLSLMALAMPCPVSGQTPPKQSADTAQIERLIRQLGSERLAEREAAGKALDAIGEPVLPLLRKAQDSSDLEIRRRAASLVKILTRRRAAMRAQPWATVKRLGGHIDSDTGTPAGQIGGIEFGPGSIGSFRDDDLVLLQWLDDVGGLSFLSSDITDAGLVHLKSCYKLKFLGLEATKITDAGLKHIGDLKNISSLVLCDTRVTDAGLPHLKKLDKLIHLDVSHLPVTDTGLEYIKELKGLGWLNLSHTQVTDAGLAKLKKLKRLNYLNLSDTRVTDAGLAHLKEIQTLKTLNLNGTKVTDRGRAELQKSLPKLGLVKH